jgi:hypothetical protein
MCCLVVWYVGTNVSTSNLHGHNLNIELMFQSFYLCWNKILHKWFPIKNGHLRLWSCGMWYCTVWWMIRWQVLDSSEMLGTIHKIAGHDIPEGTCLIFAAMRVSDLTDKHYSFRNRKFVRYFLKTFIWWQHSYHTGGIWNGMQKWIFLNFRSTCIKLRHSDCWKLLSSRFSVGARIVVLLQGQIEKSLNLFFFSATIIYIQGNQNTGSVLSTFDYFST